MHCKLLQLNWQKGLGILFFIVFFSSVAMGQQSLRITGRVTSANDSTTLPGATVLIKGTQTGIATNMDGMYTITAQKGAVLVFSFAGATKKEVTVGESAIINVALEFQSNNLNEVVVVGYGTQKKGNVTGSVATVSGRKLDNLPVGNVSSGLVGRLPGLIAVNRGGAPGDDSPQISIRGFENMLVIVDGVQNEFNNIDPNEIESISILKDAAASVYGARAGNGVLLVTTRRGKEGKPTINLNVTTGWQAPTRDAKRVDAATFARMTNEGQVALGAPLIYTDEQIAKYAAGNDPDYPNTDWYNELFKKWAPITQYNLNTSGGSEKIKYFFSLGYLDQGGILRSGDINYKRVNIRSNIDAQISKSFGASLDISGRNEQRDGPGGSMDAIMEDLSYAQPTYPAYYPDRSYVTYPGHQGTQPLGRANSKFSGYSSDNRKYANIIATLRYNAPFLDGLTAKAMFSSNLYYGYIKNFQKAYSLYNYDKVTNTYSIASPAQNSMDQLDEVLGRSTDLTTQIQVNYVKKVGPHDIGVLALAEYISNDNNNFSAHREGFLTTTIDQLFAGSELNKNNNGSAGEDGRIGYVARVNYGYDNKYLLEASVRYDASARYISTKRWAYFPGISVGWRLSEEKFLKNVTAVDNLKLRASYGLAGNDYVGQFNYLTGFNFGGNYVFGDNPVLNTGIISKGLANADLSWEKTATSNIGIEGSFWKGLIGFEFDAFYRKVTNVAGNRFLSLPSTVGATLPLENINSYDNRGFELILRHQKTLSEDFKYTIEGNVTYSRSKWLHFDEPTYVDDATRERLGISNKWKDQVYGYTALGFFQSQEEIDNWPINQDNNDNTTLKPGDIKYEDFNKDGKIDDQDNHVIGQGFTPTVFYGLNLGVEYKAFTLSALFQGAANFNAYFSGEVQIPFYNGTVPYNTMADYWTPDNRDARYPRLVPGGAINNQYTSSFWLQDATYLRLKTLQVGYTLPASLAKKAGLSSVRFLVSGYNLLTFDSIYPFDPETGTSRGWQYPQQKSYNIGVNVTF